MHRIATVMVITGGIGLACGGPALEGKRVAQHTFVPVQRCGQGPVSAHFVATGSKYGERVSFRACDVYGLSGYVDVLVNGHAQMQVPVTGKELHNQDCLLGERVAAGTGASSAERDTGTHGSGRGSAAASAATTSSATQAVFIETGDDHMCFGPEYSVDLWPMKKGNDIEIRFFSKVPLDLAGLKVQFTHDRLWPNVSEKEWARLEAEREKRELRESRTLTGAEAEAMRAKLESESGRVETVRVPPAPRVDVRPPRTSVNAEWVPGYWHWAGGDWHWLSGEWRVPAADLGAGLTLQAPHAPPSLRAESTPVGVAGLVWTPGYWLWNGSTYVWIEGRYRRAPNPGSHWQPPRWQRRAHVVVFIPGGWVLP